MSADAIRDMFRKPDSSPTIETLRKLAKGLETTPEWLIFGTESLGTFGWNPDRLKPQDSIGSQGAADQSEASTATLSAETLLPIPVIGQVEAGSFREAPEYEPDEIRYVAAPPDREFPHARRVCLDVRGDSMNDLKPRPLLEGDQAFGLDFSDIDHLIVLRDGLVVVVEQTRDGGHTREWSIKQLEIHEDRYEFCPRSTNKKHKPIVIEKKVFHDPSEDDGRHVRILALIRGSITPITY